MSRFAVLLVQSGKDESRSQRIMICLRSQAHQRERDPRDPSSDLACPRDYNIPGQLGNNHAFFVPLPAHYSPARCLFFFSPALLTISYLAPVIKVSICGGQRAGQNLSAGWTKAGGQGRQERS